MTAQNAINGHITPSAGQLNSVKLVLTSAQVKSLRATQVEIVAAPGAGKTLVPYCAFFKLTYGGSNVFATGKTICIVYNGGGSTTTLISRLSSGFLVQSANTSSTALLQTVTTSTFTGENTSLVVKVFGGSEITGNAANDNTVTIVLFYYVMSV